MPVLCRSNPLRPAMIEIIGHAQAAEDDNSGADERYFLDQLRAALDGLADGVRLRDAYGTSRIDRVGRIVARYRD